LLSGRASRLWMNNPDLPYNLAFSTTSCGSSVFSTYLLWVVT
jgi:hypothetical protein